MDELLRLKELADYKILDTLPEKELDEIAQIAAGVFDTPIALITLVDKDRQWFKANVGLDISETPRKDAFCQHALHKPNEVLVVEDPCHDERFKDNPLVLGHPDIRFYAGAPLETPSGQVLGTLCIIDDRPRTITKNQKQALMALAKKAMDYLNTRKQLLEQDRLLELEAARFKKMTDQAPGAIYQLEMKPTGEMSFPFISRGFTVIHPNLKPDELEQDASLAFNVVHHDDLEYVKGSLLESFATLKNWSVEYRVIEENGEVHWHWAHAKPERKEDGTVVWYGTFQDITERKEYIKTLEQILFDISHVMRRPVANMLGLTTAITEQDLNLETLKTCASHLKTVSEEMDSYIRKLSDTYYEAQQKLTGKNGTEQGEITS
ncbi:GAF domain-containing protein [Rufibacter roseus]|uniref:GAF domain-containing protein n=1 Tax=Rufibacter roseus TaxID=1567108 RepID=A0ABW2DJZ6_9BACT|nr:GAF domain-containing protein [Rufibacter roseus]